MICHLVADFASLGAHSAILYFTSFSVHHLEFLLYSSHNITEENLFFASNNSQEVHAEIQLN